MATPRQRTRRAITAFLAIALAFGGSFALPAQAAASPMDDVVEWLFGTDTTGGEERGKDSLGAQFGRWVTVIPNFATAEPARLPVKKPEPPPNVVVAEGTVGESLPPAVKAVKAGVGNVHFVGRLTQAIALAGLAAIATMAVFRFWIAGFGIGGGAGFQAIEGLSRTLLSAGMILCWPAFFGLTIALANSATMALLDNDMVRMQIDAAFGLVWMGSSAFDVSGLMIFVVTGGALLLTVGLVMMKVFLGAAMVFLYLAMPILIALRPMPDLAWLSAAAVRSYTVCLTVPLMWALLFAGFGAVGADALGFKARPGDGELNAVLIRPLTMLAMLAFAVQLPKSLARAALMGALSPSGSAGRSGGGFLSRAASTALGNLPTRLAGLAQQASQANARLALQDGFNAQTLVQKEGFENSRETKRDREKQAKRAAESKPRLGAIDQLPLGDRASTEAAATGMRGRAAPTPEEARKAFGKLKAAGHGRPVQNYVLGEDGKGRDPGAVQQRFTQAAGAPNVPAAQAKAFQTLALADDAARHFAITEGPAPPPPMPPPNLDDATRAASTLSAAGYGDTVYRMQYGGDTPEQATQQFTQAAADPDINSSVRHAFLTLAAADDDTRMLAIDAPEEPTP